MVVPCPKIVPVVKETETEGRLNTEARWFKVTTVVIAAAGAGLAIANAVFFDKIRSTTNGCGTTVSKKDADVMFWINVVLAIIFVILFIWALARLILAKDYREKKTEQLKALVHPVVPGVSPIRGRVVTQQPQSVEMRTIRPRTETRATEERAHATLVPAPAGSVTTTKAAMKKKPAAKPRSRKRGNPTSSVSSRQKPVSHKPQHGRGRQTVSGVRSE